ncbi:sulfite exporter TauE/SafE family protein [Woodsholea maritima]|uniref:sulfite exporter TauE/SafE family protein n=1 Tax=Woodsholea maritima TaxID=240237 RepID=UPI00038128EE|nr:sulfite exporter TauE/SafE family protein [Woodsholea maritima]
MDIYILLIIALLITGAVAGLIAGLFGIGGGIIMVPALYYVFSALGFDDTAMHAAVGTSLAVIIATSLRSVSAHAKRGAVDFALIKVWAPWIIIGALIGSALAGLAPGIVLTGLFGVVALILSAQFFFGRPDWKLAEDLPGFPLNAGLGALIGGLSSVLGIGGGVFGVTLMTVCGRTIHTAVATAAGFGIAIGLPGALGFILSGWSVEGRAPLSLGYVNFAGFAILAASAFFVAPLGAKLAHALPEKTLRKAFAVGLFIMGVNMIREVVMG